MTITLRAAESRSSPANSMTDKSIREYLSKLGKKGAEAANGQRSPEKRSKLARKAANARWKKKLKSPKLDVVAQEQTA